MFAEFYGTVPAGRVFYYNVCASTCCNELGWDDHRTQIYIFAVASDASGDLGGRFVLTFYFKW